MTKIYIFKLVLENFQFYLDKITDFTKTLLIFFKYRRKLQGE